MYQDLRTQRYTDLKSSLQQSEKKWKDSPINGEIYLNLPKKTIDNLLSIYNSIIGIKMDNNKKLECLEKENLESLVEKLPTGPWFAFWQHFVISIKNPILTNEAMINKLIHQNFSMNQSILDLYHKILEKNLPVSYTTKQHIYKYLSVTEERLIFIKQNYELLYKRYDLSVEDLNRLRGNLTAIKELYDLYTKGHNFYMVTKTAIDERKWSSIIQPISEYITQFFTLANILQISKNKMDEFQNRHPMVLECLQMKADSSIFLVVLYRYLNKPEASTEILLATLLKEKSELSEKLFLLYNKPLIDRYCDIEITSYLENQNNVINSETIEMTGNPPVLDTTTTPDLQVGEIVPGNSNPLELQEIESIRPTLLNPSDVQQLQNML